MLELFDKKRCGDEIKDTVYFCTQIDERHIDVNRGELVASDTLLQFTVNMV